MKQQPIINNPSLTFLSVRSANYSDRGWVLGFALVIMAISSLPYIVGYEIQNEAWRFTGFVFGVEDGNSYLGKMLRGADGEWLFRTPHTASKQHGALMFIPYLILGKLVAPPNQHDQLIALYHLFRITGGILAVYATYDFAALFIKGSNTRKWAVVFSTLGGGLGWLLVAVGKQYWLNSLPLDFYSPETFGFLGTYGIAHLPWSRAFLLWGLRAYLVRGGRNQDTTQLICRLGYLHPGILWLLTGIFQPITGIVFGFVISFHLLNLLIEQIGNYFQKQSTDWMPFRKFTITALIAGFIGLPYLIYNAVAFVYDPFLKVWMQQNRFPLPDAWHYIIAYILIIPFAVVGIVRVVRWKSEYGYLLVGWVVFLPVLLTIPISVQRRLVEGLWVALVVLALVAFESSKDKIFKRFFAILALTLPTTLFLLIGGFMASSNQTKPVFRAGDEVSAFEFLVENIEGGDIVVLCAYDTGNALPAWAPVFVVIGHSTESVGIANITPRLKEFYQDDTKDTDRLALLDEFGVDFVFWGPAEREYGGWKPSTAGFLTLVYSRGVYEIYQVLSPLTHSD